MAKGMRASAPELLKDSITLGGIFGGRGVSEKSKETTRKLWSFRRKFWRQTARIWPRRSLTLLGCTMTWGDSPTQNLSPIAHLRRERKTRRSTRTISQILSTLKQSFSRFRKNLKKRKRLLSALCNFAKIDWVKMMCRCRIVCFI